MGGQGAMAIKFKCQKCDTDIVVQYLLPGETAQCKYCGADNIVPGDTSALKQKAALDGNDPGNFQPSDYYREKSRMSQPAPKSGKPTWVKVVGILMIIFGVFGILGAGQNIYSPEMKKMQQNMMESFDKMAETRDDMPGEALEGFRQMIETPEWFDTWMVVSGILGVLINGLYIFSAIWLLSLKPSAVKWAYYALGISIGFALIRAIVTASANSIMVGFALFPIIVGLIIDLILLVVVIGADKDPFESEDGEIAPI